MNHKEIYKLTKRNLQLTKRNLLLRFTVYDYIYGTFKLFLQLKNESKQYMIMEKYSDRLLNYVDKIILFLFFILFYLFFLYCILSCHICRLIRRHQLPFVIFFIKIENNMIYVRVEGISWNVEYDKIITIIYNEGFNYKISISQMALDILLFT